MKRKFLLFLTALVCFSASLMAQTKTASGTVISADDNEPLIGASVKVKGTTLGQSTDIDGHFNISGIPAGAKVLEISYIGFQPQTVNIGQNLKITLHSKERVLDDVVVTGMQKMDKRLFSGATVKIDAEKMKIDGMADISRSLEGRAAGVSVQNVSGTFGTAPKIRVRGATSIYGSRFGWSTGSSRKMSSISELMNWLPVTLKPCSARPLPDSTLTTSKASRSLRTDRPLPSMVQEPWRASSL